LSPLTLDPDTAHPYLILSDDGKQVRRGDTGQGLTDNPKRFDYESYVLGKEGFSGSFYYEVQVKGKNRWTLGVARESVNRKGEIIERPEFGFWTVGLRHGFHKALTYPTLPLSLREKPQKVGVYVDYEVGQVSFFNVEARCHIYSFTGQTFTENLYPVFSPGVSYDSLNSAPLVICPVNPHTQVCGQPEVYEEIPVSPE
ncbi:E3 ubiquitin-protein ligase TRIM39-like, partial [Esox lucius]|uniref:E3 ubiquitin-protein ligase TRIM39-like n=1 Tax=Esox lucius TaxID=8010 RepID=UPI000661EB3F